LDRAVPIAVKLQLAERILSTSRIRLNYKRSIFNAIARVLFYTGVLNLFNRFANKFEYNKNEEGKLGFPFVKRRKAGNVQILVYHRVNDDSDAFFPGTPIEVFKNQMEYLAENFNICSLDSAVEKMVSKDVPDNTVVITFDDGYRDNYLNAFPTLKNLSIPATIFLATDAIGSKRVLWHDRVFSAFRETRVPVLRGLGNDSRTYHLKSVEEKRFAQAEVLKFIRSLDDQERSRWIDFLVEKLEVVDCREVPGLMLSWEEIRVMHENGISFGSHTITHPILSRLSLDRAQEEIQKSKAIIEERLRNPIRTFAYPNGSGNDFNESTKSILKEAGYVCAVTTKFGANESDHDLFDLRRATPWDQDLCSFGLRLNYYKLCS
jgi:peptidoglycan/xylan/chitin deacetylase (PgdA/CDA1 family)